MVENQSVLVRWSDLDLTAGGAEMRRTSKPNVEPAWAYVAAALIALGFPSVAKADETITAVGRVMCFDGILRPLEGVRVELMDSDCDGSEICDDTMAVGRSGPDGNFTVTGSGGDILNGKPDIYVRFAYNDDEGVRLTNEIDSTRSVSSPQHDHDNSSSGTIDFGTVTIAANLSPGEGSQCGVWSRSRQAYRAFVSEAGTAPPAGHLDILYWSAVWAGTPWTNTDTIHWPIHFRSSAASHEFGHSIRHAADGNGSHFTYDVTRFRYARVHSRCAVDANAQPGEMLASVAAFGFNEGWAEYWANDVSGCAGAMDENIEGEIARALRAVQVGNGLSRTDMVNVLKDNTGNIHNYSEFIDALGRRVGKSTGALLAAASPQPSLALDRFNTLAPPLSEIERRRSVQGQVAWLRSRIAVLRKVPTPGQLVPMPANGPCSLNACEVIFNRIVGPILREGEAGSLEVYARSLSATLAGNWSGRIQELQSSGRFESWTTAYRAKLAADVRQPMARAIDRAMATLAERAPQFAKAYSGYRDKLVQARARLAPQTKGLREGFAPAAMNSDEVLR